ncbi:hypothetical protein G9A89_016832 [Geosiphon pyriformis]|nr:hypothetical protein G9A89_016832 [Geosiphon pyriformis]
MAQQRAFQGKDIPAILAEHRQSFQKAILLQCQTVYKYAPPNSHYQYWDVYLGKAGISLMFMKIHECDPGFMLGPKSALTIAHEYIDSAIATYLAKHPHAPVDSSVPSHIELHKCGFLCTAVGLYAVAARVKHHVGDQESCDRYLNLIEANLSHACFSKHTPSELLYGRAGFLYAQKFIAVSVDPTKTQIWQSIIDGVYDAIISDGEQTAAQLNLKNQTPLFWAWHQKAYIGAAHGAAGILIILLQFPRKLEEYSQKIQGAINFVLFNCQTKNGNWPTSLGDSSAKELVQWCHGAPGIALLACKAYEVYKYEKYLEVAKKSAEFIHLNGIIFKGVGLCHGVAGNAYPFLALYQITHEEKYLQWAVEFAVVCTQWDERTEQGQFRLPDRPMSLYEGLAGSLLTCFFGKKKPSKDFQVSLILYKELFVIKRCDIWETHLVQEESQFEEEMQRFCILGCESNEDAEIE